MWLSTCMYLSINSAKSRERITLPSFSPKSSVAKAFAQKAGDTLTCLEKYHLGTQSEPEFCCTCIPRTPHHKKKLSKSPLLLFQVQNGSSLALFYHTASKQLKLCTYIQIIQGNSPRSVCLRKNWLVQKLKHKSKEPVVWTLGSQGSLQHAAQRAL